MKNFLIIFFIVLVAIICQYCRGQEACMAAGQACDPVPVTSCDEGGCCNDVINYPTPAEGWYVMSNGRFNAPKSILVKAGEKRISRLEKRLERRRNK